MNMNGSLNTDIFASAPAAAIAGGDVIGSVDFIARSGNDCRS